MSLRARCALVTCLLVCPLLTGLHAPPVARADPAVGAVTETRSGPGAVPRLVSGQPPVVEFRWGPLVGFDPDRGRLTSHLFLTATPSSFPFVPSPLAVSLESTAGLSGHDFDASLGARLGLPWLGAGLDYDLPESRLSANLTLTYPLRRGGLLRRGDLLRIDSRSAHHEQRIGASLPSPFRQYRATRQIPTGAPLPTQRLAARPDPRALPLSPQTEEALAAVDHAALWMDRFTTPRFRPGGAFEASAADLREHLRVPGHTPREERAAYHRGLEEAFAGALGGDAEAGRALARRAEGVIFARVLVPFDRALGQEKDPDDPAGLCTQALAEFDSSLVSAPPGPDPPGAEAEPMPRVVCREVFRRALVSVRRAALQSRDRWRESFLLWNDHARLAWLPLSLGLREDQYDTQAEWDSVLSQLTGQHYTGANDIEYLMLEQFHVQLKRMLRETRDYQVTIVHDFRGRNNDGGTDIYGWDMVVDGYLAAFAQAVRDLDAGRRTRLPRFYLFLDEHYYARNHGRAIVSYLEQLYAPPDLELRNQDIAVQVRAAQDTLRELVAHSPALAGLSEDELSDRFRVHVLITNPLDPAFTLDVLRRDHRKIAFRDVTEADPSSGSAVVTGEGVGEHYNGTGWEDRSLLVRGSALVQIKDATRRLLLDQGCRPGEVPEPLRAQAFPDDYAERCARLREQGWDTPVSIVMNETGYGPKAATVLKAAMYDLAPDGCTLIGFDSLWLSELWAGMFVGAALRSAHMYAVAPSPINAPSSGVQVLCFMRQTLDLLFRAQGYFAPEIAAERGSLRVGLYAHDVSTHDFGRRGAAFLGGRAQQPWLREQFPMDPGIDSLLVRFIGRFEDVPMMALKLRARPFLHLKFQFFATREAMEILPRREWAPVLARHLAIRLAQTQGLHTGNLTPEVLKTTDGRSPGLEPLLPAFERALAARDPDAPRRVIFTTTIGSHNQDPRSLFLDGEVTVAVAGPNCLVTAPDFMFILGITRWPDTRAEFDRLYPEQQLPLWMRPLRGFLQSQN